MELNLTIDYENVGKFKKDYKEQFNKIDNRNIGISVFVETQIGDDPEIPLENNRYFMNTIGQNKHGIIVFVNNKIRIEKIEKNQNFDIISLDCVLQEKKFKLIAVYVKYGLLKQKNLLCDFYDEINKSAKQCKDAIICVGDFNSHSDYCDGIPKYTPNFYNGTVPFRHFMDLFVENELKQKNTIKAPQSRNWVDLLLVNDKVKNIKCTIINTIQPGFGEQIFHFPIRFEMCL